MTTKQQKESGSVGLAPKLTKIEKLSSDPANVRKHSARNIEAIKASLRRFGQQKPIVVNADGVVIAGNGTLEAARGLGWKEISVVRSLLDGADAIAYAIADNRTAELAEWDDNALSELIFSLADSEDLMDVIGFNSEEIARIIPDEIEFESGDPVEDWANQKAEADGNGSRQMILTFSLSEYELFVGDISDLMKATGSRSPTELIMMVIRERAEDK